MPIEDDKAGATVELGPRSMSLLRRLVHGLELQLGHPIPDLGRQYEDEEALVPVINPTRRIGS